MAGIMVPASIGKSIRVNSVEEAAQLVKKGKVEKPKGEETDKFVPVYLPTDIDGVSMIQVRTRKDFIDEGIGMWRDSHILRFTGIALAIVSLIVYFYQPLLSLIPAIAGGLFYGQYAFKRWYMTQVLTKRPVLYTG